jgi:hypothetical protein
VSLAIGKLEGLPDINQKWKMQMLVLSEVEGIESGFEPRISRLPVRSSTKTGITRKKSSFGDLLRKLLPLLFPSTVIPMSIGTMADISAVAFRPS